jgi:hypothetical protein
MVIASSHATGPEQLCSLSLSVGAGAGGPGQTCMLPVPGCSIVSYLKDSKVQGAVMVNNDGQTIQ